VREGGDGGGGRETAREEGKRRGRKGDVARGKATVREEGGGCGRDHMVKRQRNQSTCSLGALQTTWTENMRGSWSCSGLLSDNFDILEHG
jgi:hypothetical protein